MKTKIQIILASKSPRRKELLKGIGLEFSVCESKFEEKDTHLTPEELARHNARGKAMDVAKHSKNALIIGVDTVVAYENHIIGKPKSKEDAKRILKILSGTTHRVISSIFVINTNTKIKMCEIETTKVKMAHLSEKEIDRYIKTGEGDDKAGGFAIQGLGALFIEKIEGDYFNVVGLPIFCLRKILQKQGVEIL
jgi:septum formation protein